MLLTCGHNRIRIVEYDAVPAIVLRCVECTIRSGNRALRRASDAAGYRCAEVRRDGPGFTTEVERRNGNCLAQAFGSLAVEVVPG